jgi:hypothetical protein
MNPRIPKNSDVHIAPKNGVGILFQDSHQFTPAETKKAPDRNLQTSFQLIFFILLKFIGRLLYSVFSVPRLFNSFDTKIE